MGETEVLIVGLSPRVGLGLVKIVILALTVAFGAAVGAFVVLAVGFALEVALPPLVWTSHFARWNRWQV